jgi:Ulp1 family protease
MERLTLVFFYAYAMFQVQVPDPHLSKVQDSYLTIQMSRINGKNKDIVPVKIHKVQQQTNSVDCGAFAIAFMTEFCFSGWTFMYNKNT